MNIPKVVKIKRIIKESDSVKTFIFNWKIQDEKPGQFMMVWNFTDEKPMSISLIDSINDEMGISIKKVGKFTESLHSLKPGDELGLRGPYGRGFEIKGNNILVIGGGIGMAPLSALIDEATGRGVTVDVICAAQTENELLYREKMERAGASVLTCTDDGSHGFCGFPTELANQILTESSYDMIATCGPEIMMKGVFDLVDHHKIPAQFSLERYMKCAMGLCGQCCVDNTGWRICVEGPVFTTDEVRLIREFAKYRRDASGIKHKL
ncbi:MAG: dihydroorotate dehydrogenase electron transfer subunit [Methanobacteriaceae archaeon]|nr:dihydroorotate dehydrogenase electron transfer subunit [Methanobacteriaceae archaeon]